MSKTSQHIVFLTPGFAQNEQDTTTIPAMQVYLKKLQEALPGCRLTIIAFQYPFTKEKYNWHRFDIIPLNGRNRKFRKLRIWQNAKNVLQNLHKATPITAVHSFWIGECSFIGQRFASKNNIPHITTAMGQDVHPKNIFTRFINQNLTKTVTQSPIQQQLLFKNHRIPSQVIPWDLDREAFPELETTTIDILGVGSLNEVKNFGLFIDIIQVLAQKNPALKVAIIGNGNQYGQLKEKIALLHLEGNITLLGQIPRAEVLKKMAASKILLHTSRYEGFGYVFAEALYCGMQLVSFPVGTAAPSKNWKIAESKETMIAACEAFLNEPHTEKQRTDLFQTETTVSYLKLYDEKTH